MNSEVPKWMSPEPAGCFPNRSEEASQNETEEDDKEEEMERCKRPRTTLDSEGGVEEFLVLLDRIEEMKKHLKRKRMNFSGSSISAGGGMEDQMLMAIPSIEQAQISSDAIDMIASNKSTTSPWKPSFRWEDFNTSNSLSVKTDLSGAAATEKSKDEEGSIQTGNSHLETRCFLDGDTPAECSHDKEEEEDDDVDAPPELELQLFPCRAR